ncbi:tctex1 domain-containing protein 1-B-like [Actinia tenebrosa]|uniref:Tctex1 domain-containing protein 1-B-like n=1 Tax=Actinia tenebrosa TaxID=6105 RepID=A0A6P8HUA5_ACTTE|nr:tctex1 domain-containing protein 1-B-like [Actinia tenebrosa]
MALQKRSSSSSSLFSLPTSTSYKTGVQKGNFMTSHYDSPAANDLESSSTTRSSRITKTVMNRRFNVFQNTYKMYPDKTVNETKVRQIIKRNLQVLENETYDPKCCRDLSKSLSNGILRELKMLGIARYKFVCTVTIGQLRGQTLRVASRCIWDHELDSFVSESLKNKTLFAVATVYGIYQE